MRLPSLPSCNTAEHLDAACTSFLDRAYVPAGWEEVSETLPCVAESVSGLSSASPAVRPAASAWLGVWRVFRRLWCEAACLVISTSPVTLCCEVLEGSRSSQMPLRVGVQHAGIRRSTSVGHLLLDVVCMPTLFHANTVCQLPVQSCVQITGPAVYSWHCSRLLPDFWQRAQDDGQQAV